MKEKNCRSVIAAPRWESGMSKRGVNENQLAYSDRSTHVSQLPLLIGWPPRGGCLLLLFFFWLFTSVPIHPLHPPCSHFLFSQLAMLVCQSCSGPPALPFPLLHHPHPHYLCFLRCSLAPAATYSSTRVAQSYRDPDHRGNLPEKVLWLLAWSQRGRAGERRRQTLGATLCARRGGKKRGRRKLKERRRAACLEQDAIRWCVWVVKEQRAALQGFSPLSNRQQRVTSGESGSLALIVSSVMGHLGKLWNICCYLVLLCFHKMKLVIFGVFFLFIFNIWMFS